MTNKFAFLIILSIASFIFSFWLFRITPVRKEVVERITEKVKEVTPDNPCESSMSWRDSEIACNAAYTCKLQDGRLIEYKGYNDFKCEYDKKDK